MLEADGQESPPAPRTTAVPADQSSIDARIRLHQLYQEARAAMAEANWPRAENLIRQVVQQDERFADARRTLGIAAADTVRALLYGQGHNIYGFDNQPQLDLAALAIRWLEEARRWAEDSDGRVSAALATMYGLAQRREDMLSAIDDALRRDPDRRADLVSAESLVCLLRACTADRDADTIKRVRELGDRLQIQMPASARDFQASIAAHAAASAGGTGQVWLAFARRSYWEGKADSDHPGPLAQLLVFVGRRPGGQETKGRYFPRRAPAVNLPEEPDAWFPADQLFDLLDGLFILIFQIDNIPPVTL